MKLDLARYATMPPCSPIAIAGAPVLSSYSYMRLTRWAEERAGSRRRTQKEMLFFGLAQRHEGSHAFSKSIASATFLETTK